MLKAVTMDPAHQKLYRALILVAIVNPSGMELDVINVSYHKFESIIILHKYIYLNILIILNIFKDEGIV